MLSKKFALGFGIAILFPMLVHYGVWTFSPPPNSADFWKQYGSPGYLERYRTATPEEQKKLTEQQDAAMDRLQEGEKRFNRYLFYVTTPVGIAAIIIGSVMTVVAIGTGLIFGGILALCDGYVWYWNELPNWLRFLSLLVAFTVLVIIGYRRFAE